MIRVGELKIIFTFHAKQRLRERFTKENIKHIMNWLKNATVLTIRGTRNKDNHLVIPSLCSLVGILEINKGSASFKVKTVIYPWMDTPRRYFRSGNDIIIQAQKITIE